eukprot:10467136-Heterocapsa_arctica.AAC.1
MTAKRPDGSYGPVYTPTRWISNRPGILARLTRGRAAAAAIYPPNRCAQILRGFRDQIRHDEALSTAECRTRTLDQELNSVDWVQDHTVFRDE